MTSIEEMLKFIYKMGRQNLDWEPKHPQYIEGTFWLTQEQWDAIQRSFPRRTDNTMIYGFPVKVVEPYVEYRLRSGRILMFSKVINSIVTFDPEVIETVKSSKWKGRFWTR